MKFYLSLLLIKINFIFSYIKIPFKTFELNDINNLYNNYVYINLDIGIPQQNNTKIVLKQGKYSFFLYDNNKYINASYNYKLSKTYRKVLDEKLEFTSSTCFEGLFSQDTFYIENKEIKNLSFVLCSRTKTEEYFFFDGEIGLNLLYEFPETSNFVKILKGKEIINNYIYSINYINDKEGYLLIGEYPHNIKRNSNIYDKYSDFNKNNLYWIHSIVTKNSVHWTISFDKISYGDGGAYQAQREARILVETKYIISSTQYYNSFKEIFGRKCTIILLDEDLEGYKCTKDINKELTPEIRLFNRELNTTFVLDYNDLYFETDNYFFFLVTNIINYDPGYWILGKPFLKKYLLLFDYDNKMIGFYKNSENKKNKSKGINSYSLSLFFNIFLVIVIICLAFAFYQYYIKKRRIRANELEDKFNYTAKNDK